jgi:signal transduction histidine kinase
MHDFPGEITPEQPKTIMNETRRLTALVNDVLDISKLESELEQLNPEKFSLTASVSDSVERMNELLKNEGFTITFSYDSDVYVDADEAKISRAFYNLLINAANYSGDSREVAVTQTLADGYARISVTDSGEGIAEKELPYIWDRYYKSGKKHKRAVTGSGLGLSIVKKIIELHGGRCGVSSELGRGSVFWFEVKSEYSERRESSQ